MTLQFQKSLISSIYGSPISSPCVKTLLLGIESIECWDRYQKTTTQRYSDKTPAHICQIISRSIDDGVTVPYEDPHTWLVNAQHQQRDAWL